MSVFALARMRRPALVGEYLRWCAPPDAVSFAASPPLRSLRHAPKYVERCLMSREALVAAILAAAETGAKRF